MLTCDQKYRLRKKLKCKAGTDYLNDVYNLKLFKSKVKSAIKVIRAFYKKSPFDAIVFCGHSGAAFAFPIGLALNIPIVCIRKREELEFCHCDRFYEGILPKKYIIIDDRIFTGKTIDRIEAEVNAEIDIYNEGIKWEKHYSLNKKMDYPKMLAIFLYDVDVTPYRTEYAGTPVILIDYDIAERKLVQKAKQCIKSKN